MKKPIKYITFDNSEAFEKWQNESPEKMILNVIPLLVKVEANTTANSTQVAHVSPYDVFVTYI